MTELKLRLKQGNADKTIKVVQDAFTIGRLPECNLYLPFGGISRYHARLVKASVDVWTIEDLGSKNGTHVNNKAVTGPQQLNHGDVILLGNISLQVVLKDTQPLLTKAQQVGQQRTILRNVQQLQESWIEAEENAGVSANKDKTIARLKDLVNIAKNLSAAASIEEIFSQVQQVVFRYLNSIDRLALLIDIKGCGKPELMNAAARSPSQQQNLAADGSWISRSICQKVFAEKVAIQIADAQKDERFASEHSILMNDIRSAMAVPLWDENKVVGVLYADAHLSSYHWEEEGEQELRFFSISQYCCFQRSTLVAS